MFKSVTISYRGGDEENRTPDPLLARQVLSQLSYTPEWELTIINYQLSIINYQLTIINVLICIELFVFTIAA